MNRNQTEKFLRTALAPGGEAVIPAPAGLPDDGLLAATLARRGAVLIRIDRAPVFDKPSLLHALYQACRMPAWFGFNWDALLDCLTDLTWMPARAYVLAVRDARPLRERAPGELDTLLEIARAASARWAARGVRFVLLIGPG